MQLYPDVRRALARLSQDYALATISNGNADIEIIGIGHYFSHKVQARDVGVAKPAPAIFEHALAALELEPHQVLHVGDDPGG